MKTLLTAASALTLATAGVAQVPPTTGAPVDPMDQPVDDSATPPDASPMDETMTDDGMTVADPMDEPTTREGMAPATSPMAPAPGTSMPTTSMPAPMTSAPAAPRMVPSPTAGQPQPTPEAAPPSTGPGEYQLCTKQVTDRCVNPSDVRRGIAKRPGR